MPPNLNPLFFSIGSAWLSGINLYITLLTLGLLQRFHYADLPGDLSYLSHTWMLVVSGGLFAIQFIADKIPAVDSIWDVIHTFIKVPAGAILAATAFAHFDPSIRLLAFVLGGGIALSSHGAKTASRLAANTSPEPFSNVILSILGDAMALGGTLLMAVHPLVVAVIAVCGVVLSMALVSWIVRAFGRLFRRRESLY